MENLIAKFFIRGTGITVGIAGLFLIIETAKIVPSFVYVISPVFGVFALGIGLFCLLYDGWITWVTEEQIN